MPILVEIVTPERRLLSQEVDMVTLPGITGQMGILRGHAPLLTTLDIGELCCTQKPDSNMLPCTVVLLKFAPTK